MEVEALAASKVVEFGNELGLHNTIIEGNSVVVAMALKCKEFGLVPYAHLLKDVSLFSSLYSQLSYSHVEISTLYSVDGGCSILHFTFCSG